MNDTLPEFTLDNYPKSHASLDGWRLHEYLHLPVEDQERVFKQLEKFCLHRAENCPALTEHKDYAYIGSGWEWSVFAKDASTVIKVPSGIFPEVNKPSYLVNAQKSFSLLQQYFPSNMLAETKFNRHDDTNVIEQERLSGQDNKVIEIDKSNQWLLQKLQVFFQSTLSLLENEIWLPDFWLNEDPRGFVLRNVMIDQEQDQFKIVDFTSYLDPARMYPDMRERHCQLHTGRVQIMLNQVSSRLNNA